MSEQPADRPLGLEDLRQLLDQAPWGIGMLGPDHRHRFINATGCRITGLSTQEILGRTDFELGWTADDTENRRLAEEVMASGETRSTARWTPDQTGRQHFVERVFYPNRAPDGSVDGYWEVVRDFTELKLAEARSAAMVATALDCIIVIDAAGRILEFNPAAERTFGYARTEVLGRAMVDLIVPPQLRQRHSQGLGRYLETDQPRILGQRVEIEAMRADGTVFPVELAIAEIRLAGERTFTAYLRDLTSAREAQAEIERHREALVQSEKMAAFGSLLAGLAHELNNPLSIVLGQALMLKEAAEGSAHADRAEKIEQAAERCARIARSFLAMARRETLEPAPVSMAAIVSDVLGLLAYDLRSSGVQVTLDLSDDLPLVLGDADRLHQVLANLLTNARHALDAQPQPRTVAISASVRGEALEVAVRDNGPGVPEEIRSRLFDPFFTTKPMGSGTGIGLTVSRGIAESHGGSLTLAAGPGGACFVLSLPTVDDEALAPAAAHPTAPEAPAGSRRLLVIDDEPEIAAILAEIAAGDGFDCALATSGGQALELMAAGAFDAVLCDLRLPDHDGLAIHAWMAKNRPGLVPRLAFVTGDTLGQGAAVALAELGRPILEKPFAPADVRRLLGELRRVSVDA